MDVLSAAFKSSKDCIPRTCSLLVPGIANEVEFNGCSSQMPSPSMRSGCNGMRRPPMGRRGDPGTGGCRWLAERFTSWEWHFENMLCFLTASCPSQCQWFVVLHPGQNWTSLSYHNCIEWPVRGWYNQYPKHQLWERWMSQQHASKFLPNILLKAPRVQRINDPRGAHQRLGSQFGSTSSSCDGNHRGHQERTCGGPARDLAVFRDGIGWTRQLGAPKGWWVDSEMS